MANDAAALQLVQPVPAPAPASESIEHRVGAAVADAVGVIGAGLVEFWEGRLDDATRAMGGEVVARVFELKQAVPSELDFAAIAHEHGLKVLRARYIAFGYEHQTFPEIPTVKIIDGLLKIVDRVSAQMRAMAH